MGNGGFVSPRSRCNVGSSLLTTLLRTVVASGGGGGLSYLFRDVFTDTTTYLVTDVRLPPVLGTGVGSSVIDIGAGSVVTTGDSMEIYGDPLAANAVTVWSGPYSYEPGLAWMATVTFLASSVDSADALFGFTTSQPSAGAYLNGNCFEAFTNLLYCQILQIPGADPALAGADEGCAQILHDGGAFYVYRSGRIAHISFASGGWEPSGDVWVQKEVWNYEVSSVLTIKNEGVLVLGAPWNTEMGPVSAFASEATNPDPSGFGVADGVSLACERDCLVVAHRMARATADIVARAEDASNKWKAHWERNLTTLTEVLSGVETQRGSLASDPPTDSEIYLRTDGDMISLLATNGDYIVYEDVGHLFPAGTDASLESSEHLSAAKCITWVRAYPLDVSNLLSF